MPFDQAVRELGQRFDFKGTDAAFELEETTVTMIASRVSLDFLG